MDLKRGEAKGAAVAEATKPADLVKPAISGEAIIARARVHYAITVVVGIFVTCISLGLLARLSVPLAHAIAGKHTNFTLTVSFSVSAVLGATTALSTGGMVLQGRRAGHHKTRARELEKQVKSLTGEQATGKD